MTLPTCHDIKLALEEGGAVLLMLAGFISIMTIVVKKLRVLVANIIFSIKYKKYIKNNTIPPILIEKQFEEDIKETPEEYTKLEGKDL